MLSKIYRYKSVTLRLETTFKYTFSMNQDHFVKMFMLKISLKIDFDPLGPLIWRRCSKKFWSDFDRFISIRFSGQQNNFSSKQMLFYTVNNAHVQTFLT